MKPYIICYMMTSIDGRIDCGMTAQLKGVDEYYQVLEELNMPTTVSGRTTAELEMALPGRFEVKNTVPYGKEGFSKKADAPGYEVIVDTKGTLLWERETSTEKPHLIVTSTQVSKEYLEYLNQQNISWIVCGNGHIDLKRASEILAEKFGVKRMGIVGGPTINTVFLEAELLDEVDILIGPGIDGRAEMPSVFEGRKETEPLPLKLTEIKSYDDGAVLLRYRV
ncbi:RibD family protein [Baileyella intestinalis]|uniref:RibD family protein n=1 Tax=Baileyella intestinalis TaxID=2606709 RepID=UPI0022E86A02|nr:dihydrofolate reductase family protein [Baileyella intestinalis]